MIVKVLYGNNFLPKVLFNCRHLPQFDPNWFGEHIGSVFITFPYFYYMEFYAIKSTFHWLKK